MCILDEGGALTIRFKEYHHTLKLFKKIEHYGDGNVVVSSSAWHEMEQTIKRREHRYFAMLSNGEFMNIEPPTRESEYGDECVIVKKMNKDFE